MTALETETESIESLDFDEPKACEYRHAGQPCGKRAEYLGWFTCCGASGLFCQPCLDGKLAWHEKMLGKLRCSDCGVRIETGTLKWRPLGGGA